TAEIKALRDLGRTDEADKLQKRLESLSASQAKPTQACGSRTTFFLLRNFAVLPPPLLCLYASCMFGKPRQLETEAELYDAALRVLLRRAHSVHEMKKKLERRSDNKLLVQLVITRLKENGLIDDARYAKQFARQRTE